jgi:V-type H+-transporting ATPase subunit a
MLFGLVLGLTNSIYNNNRLSIWFEFVPRFAFLSCTFGYMNFLIVYKWTVDWSVVVDRDPPSLITTMVAMFLQPGTVEEHLELYPGQATVQVVCLLVCFVSVPLMLFPLPYFTNKRYQRELAEHNRIHDIQDEHAGEGAWVAQGGVLGEEDVEEEEAGEGVGKPHLHFHVHGVDGQYSFDQHMIIQGIHTIEFCLGCVSNTASYLRLWALSLAHSELADVFWDKMFMDYGVKLQSPITVVAATAIWCGATVGVLLVMDTLECFLHTLRLHWVEHNSKIPFLADGYAFEPLSFEDKDVLPADQI